MSCVLDRDPVESMLQALGAPAADRDYRPGHARMRALLQMCAQHGIVLHRPHLRIRVAGTNGKGSTATMVAAGLRAAGLSVGLYTSPHIVRFHERISIDGRSVDDVRLQRLLRELLPMAQDVGASYFELATTLALAAFSVAKVDVEVLEAGVGGRLDATTAVEADMALLTPIALDHQAWLGDSLAEIAEEKAYVGAGCRWRLHAQQDLEVATVLERFSFLDMVKLDGAMKPAMVGMHQQQNGALARAALQRLHRDGAIAGAWSEIESAALAARMAGRLQCYQRGKHHAVWLDAAHNWHAVKAIGDWVCEPMDALLVYTREDRSLTDALPLLRRMGRCLVGAEGDDLDVALPTVEAGLEWARCNLVGGRWLVLGSFVTVAAAQRWLAANDYAEFEGAFLNNEC
ncbi:MAG: bifunctional folylpolyglutamate synthase/dihydrofolate synthase [Mariprofundales bacterium]